MADAAPRIQFLKKGDKIAVQVGGSDPCTIIATIQSTEEGVEPFDEDLDTVRALIAPWTPKAE